MTAALMKCENCKNLSRLKSRGLFLQVMSLIGHADLSDYHEIWPVRLLHINAVKVQGFNKIQNNN